MDTNVSRLNSHKTELSIERSAVPWKPYAETGTAPNQLRSFSSKSNAGSMLAYFSVIRAFSLLFLRNRQLKWPVTWGLAL